MRSLMTKHDTNIRGFILTTRPSHQVCEQNMVEQKIHKICKKKKKSFRKKRYYFYLCVENRSFGLRKIGFRRRFCDLTVFGRKLLTHHPRKKSCRLRSSMRKSHRSLRRLVDSQARFVHVAGRNVCGGTLHAIRFEDWLACRHLGKILNEIKFYSKFLNQ